MGKAYDIYVNKIPFIENKVIKIKGSCKEGTIFAYKVESLKKCSVEYYIDLKSKKHTEILMETVEENPLSGDVSLITNCHWLKYNNELIKTNQPKICKVHITDKQINELKNQGLDIKEWIKK